MSIITNPRTHHINRLVVASLAVLATGGLLVGLGDLTVDERAGAPIGADRGDGDRPSTGGPGDRPQEEVPTTESPSSPEPPAPATPTPAPDAGDPEPAPAPEPAAELEDGHHFGYLVGYEAGATGTIAHVDLATFFTGDEADAAAAEDGAITEGEQVENDVYVRNTNPRLRRVAFRDGAGITVVECSAGCSDVRADLAALRDRPMPTPVWLTVEDGVIVLAEEQYLP